MTAAFPLFFALGLIEGLPHVTAIARTASRAARADGSATANHAARPIPKLFDFGAAACHGSLTLLTARSGLLVARAVLLRRLERQA